MLRDVLPFADQWRHMRKDSRVAQAIQSFVHFVERKTGGLVVFDTAHYPFMRPELADLLLLAEKLREMDIIKWYAPRPPIPDEPPMYLWNAVFRDGEEQLSGGASIESDRAALTAALAEAIERHIWFEKTDYFRDLRQATTADIVHIGPALLPNRFTSFSDEVRRAHPHLILRDVPYTWILGKQPDGSSIYVPAYAVSGSRAARAHREPVIVYPITTGLATWPTRDGAILRGILEGIERDAYMITWLNQLSGTRFDIETLSAKHPSLETLVKRCRRYRLEPHIVRLVTDAPTYAICAVLEDTTGNAPRYAHGLKAGADPANVAEGAIIEALRARQASLAFMRKKVGTETLETDDVGHFKRLLYWAEGNRHERLAFFHTGEVRAQHEAWEGENEDDHLRRLYAWIEHRRYGCASVAFTRSSANPTPWHIEYTLIPELQRMHFTERVPYTGGTRLAEVPRACGYTPREEPYLSDPHPFA